MKFDVICELWTIRKIYMYMLLCEVLDTVKMINQRRMIFYVVLLSPISGITIQKPRQDGSSKILFHTISFFINITTGKENEMKNTETNTLKGLVNPIINLKTIYSMQVNIN